MSDTGIAAKESSAENTEPRKATRETEESSKRLFKNKKILMGFFVLILISPLIYGFVTGKMQAIQARKAPQGELIFYVMYENDIKDAKLKEWITEKHKIKGIHSYKENKASGERYILLATGEQPMKDIDIIMESVVGYKDKILVNGRVAPPKSDIVKEKSYPYQLIRIESENDPRAVQLGTMNLYDVSRGMSAPVRMSLDNAIVKEVNRNTVKLATFKKEENQLLYTMTKKALRQFKEQGIVLGDLVSVTLNTDVSKGYPKVEDIRKTTRAVEKIKITKVSKENKTLTVAINKNPFVFSFREEMQDKVAKAKLYTVYLARLEKVGDVIYITDIIGI